VVRVNLGDGLVMTMTQRHTGSSTGRWQVADGRLTSPAAWDGDLAVHTTVAINGRSANQTVNLPVAGLDGVDAAFSCAPRELMIQAEGSPFSYLFH
jgi:hypothetical protein